MTGSLLLRRRWFFGAVAGGAVSMWSIALRAAPRSENAHERVRKKLISLLRDPQRAREIGAAYLRSPPEQRAPPLALAETVLVETGPAAGIEAIRRYVVARIRRELEDAQVVSLDGWIISPTEAQLCALVAADGAP